MSMTRFFFQFHLRNGKSMCDRYKQTCLILLLEQIKYALKI